MLMIFRDLIALGDELFKNKSQIPALNIKPPLGGILRYPILITLTGLLNSLDTKVAHMPASKKLVPLPHSQSYSRGTIRRPSPLYISFK
jgi:hypothetical protein